MLFPLIFKPIALAPTTSAEHQLYVIQNQQTKLFQPKVRIQIGLFRQTFYQLQAALDLCFRRRPLYAPPKGRSDLLAQVPFPRATHALRKHVRLIVQQNQGVSAARNLGISESRHPWIAFLDSDDLWEPEKLTIQMEALATSPDTLIVHCRELWLRSGRTISQTGQRHRRAGWLFADAVRKCIIGPSTVLLHRSVLNDVGGFRHDLQIAEDYELWLRVTARYPVAYCDRELVIKRAGHGNQLSERYGHIERFRVEALAPLVEADHWQEPERSIARQELARKCVIHAAGARKRGHDVEAARYESLARKASISAANSGSCAAYSRIERR